MASKDNSIKVITLNVRGLNDSLKRKKVFDWLKQQKPQIVFLQETFCTKRLEPYLNSMWKGKIIHSLSDSSHSRGVSILLSENLEYNIVDIHESINGRNVMLNIEMLNNMFTLVSVYAPNRIKERSEYFKGLHKWFNRYSLNPDNTIICGDFNCCIGKKDRSPDTHLNDMSRTEFSNFVKVNNLIDMFTLNNDNCNGFTYIDKKVGTKSRLDYVFVSEKCILQKGNCKSMHAISCDHKAVVANLNFSENIKGKGYWKLNNSIINDDTYKNGIQHIMNETIIEYKNVKSKRLIWEVFKIKVKEFSIKYSITLKKQNDFNVSKIQKRLDEINNIIDNGIGNNDIEIEKSQLEIDINDYYEKKAKGYQIRSRAKWIQEGERSTKYFLGLEQKRQLSNHITQINNGDKVVYSDKEILEETALFYEKLYASANINVDKIDQYLENINIETKLNDDEKRICDEEITEKELNLAVKKLKDNKSPGNDGLTPEFYKSFWPTIKILFIQMINESFIEGELPDSLKKSILALLFKKGDHQLLKNYRPISLSNYDYKIIAFTLATRLQKVIKKLVNKDQTAYIKSRFIGCNIRLISDIIDHANLFDLPGIILCLDFEKAFDSLDWNFMFKILEKFNFGINFIKWIRILYTNPKIEIKNNGWISREIPLSRGVRQGCPISALLFILAVEILAISIKNNTNIKGYKIDEQEIKIVQHADDSTLLLRDKNSIKEALLSINEFSKVTGLKLNINKTEGIWTGSFKNNEKEFNDICFNKETIKCLGIYIGNNTHQCSEKNWESKLKNFEKIIESWKSRKLTLFGKVQIVNSLAISQLIYNFTLVKTPEYVIKKVQTIIYNFIWNKKDRIKRNNIIGPKKQGGLGLVDIQSKIQALQASWIPRIFNTDSSWKIFPRFYAKKLGFEIISLLKTHFTEWKNDILPEFYQNILTSFHKCKTYIDNTKLTELAFFTETVWLNERYKFKNKYIYYKHWVKSGFVQIKDFYDENGNFLADKIIFERLNIKSNWISELKTLKKVINNVAKRMKTNMVKFINYKKQPIFLFKTFTEINDQKSKFFYQILISKKFQRSSMEHVWSKKFNCINNSSIWENIYKEKITKEKYTKFAEFNFKLLHNILPCGNIVSKWNRNVSKFCAYCNSIETIEHIYYECPRIKSLWYDIGLKLEMNIQMKHIVIGYHDNSIITYFRNRIFTIVLYTIYCRWVEYSEDPEKYKLVDFHRELKSTLPFYTKVYKQTESESVYRLFELFTKKYI